LKLDLPFGLILEAEGIRQLAPTNFNHSALPKRLRLTNKFWNRPVFRFMVNFDLFVEGGLRMSTSHKLPEFCRKKKFVLASHAASRILGFVVLQPRLSGWIREVETKLLFENPQRF
jgi:hypothetical protein